MLKFAITQSAPDSPLAPVSYLCGRQNTAEHIGEFFDAVDTLEDALMLVNQYVPADKPFVIEYIPWTN